MTQEHFLDTYASNMTKQLRLRILTLIDLNPDIEPSEIAKIISDENTFFMNFMKPKEKSGEVNEVLQNYRIYLFIDYCYKLKGL
ncbi:hypothetical protein [Lactococcus petauri]|uniref:hypothetical protein n=1 Tax=Lactococcus petauri TaxID=1940789 RepID=UPI0021527FFE|nr:hypothetical protein [Lactococcus petauri]MCR6590488.1 hypothetical protein [Lactococcus petauri]